MKRLVSLALALLMALSLTATAFADYTDASGYDPAQDEQLYTPSSDDGSGVSVHAEETKVYYRTVNGRKQMRIWSVTYSKWLTDWIDIGPADWIPNLPPGT